MADGIQIVLEYYDVKTWHDHTYFEGLNGGSGSRFRGRLYLDVHFGRPQVGKFVDEESNYTGSKIIFRQTLDETRTFEFLVPDFMTDWMHFVATHSSVTFQSYDDSNLFAKGQFTYTMVNKEFEEDTDRFSGLKIGRFRFEVEKQIDSGCDETPHSVVVC